MDHSLLNLMQLPTSVLRAAGVVVCWGLTISIGLYRRKRSPARAAAVAGFFWGLTAFWLVLVAQFALDGAWGLALPMVPVGGWVIWAVHGHLADL